MYRRLLFILLAVLLPGGIARGAGERADYFAKLNASALQPGQTAVMAVVVDIKPGFHAQSHTPLDEYKIKFLVVPKETPGIEFLDPIYPAGVIDNSPALGKQSIYTGRVIVYVPMRVKSAAAMGNVTLDAAITYQICDDHVCYRPDSNQPISLATKIVTAETAVTQENAELFTGFDQSIFAKGAKPAATVVQRSQTIDFFGHGFNLGFSSYGWAILIALAVGVMFNLVPCVLPVVPLKAIGFMEVSRNSRGRCFLLGAVFSLGIVTVFIGLAALLIPYRAATHFTWGAEFKYPIFVWTMVVILVAMALGMFGLFDVALPQSVYNFTPRHDTIVGNYLFGMLTAVLSTPCTAPMFAGILAWSIAQPTALGMTTVVMVGVGMALPYLLLSAFPETARWVPRSGPWSAVLKQMMGFLVLAVAVYFAGGQLASTKIFFWAVFGVIAAAMVFLLIRAIQLSGRIWPVLASVAASVLVIGFTLHYTLDLVAEGLQWQPYSQKAFDEARATGKPVLVEFTANWCSNCIALESTVYRDPKTAKAIEQRKIILLRADLTAENAPGWDVVNQLNPGGGIPLTAIYGPHQTDPVKLTSLYRTGDLLAALDRATSG